MRRNIKLKEELRAEARRCELLHFERPEDRPTRADKCRKSVCSAQGRIWLAG